MRQTLVLLGILAILQGAMGLTYDLYGWKWGVVQQIPLFDGYELFMSVVLLTLGVALLAVGRSLKES
ncbi:hypothetical protein [Streptomyces parvulus]|uniref:hypothetical protein n=1 Tax=Streptomyces parvulus TaxID=146923 RepID=UPI003425C141